MQPSQASPDSRPNRSRNPVRRLIGDFDDHLSKGQGVRLFSQDESCLLRYATIISRHDLRLSDGTEIRRGDTVVDIHCWNGHVPAMSRSGPSIAWAQDTSRRFRRSLRLLAEALDTDPALAEVKACRAQVNFVGQGGSHASVSRIISRMGFEDVDEGSDTLWSAIHHGLENVLIAALVWTHNPDALRRDKMLRERRPVWASRTRMLEVHRRVSGADEAAQAA